MIDHMQFRKMATSQKPDLGTLPAELQERVFSFCSFRTLLRLSLTNKAIHHNTGGAPVIRAIINNRQGRGGQVWRYPYPTAESPSSVWARYALADDKAGLEVPLGMLFRCCKDAMLWAPQLLALQRNPPDIS